MSAVTLGPDGFPKRGLSEKKQKEWLAAHRPDGDLWFDVKFYRSQSAAFLDSSSRWLGVSLGFLAVGVVAQIVLVIVEAAS